METGIKIDQTNDAEVKVEQLLKLLNGIDKTKFQDDVAIKALDVLGESFANPITIQNCSITSDESTDNSVTKYYKGSVTTENKELR